MALSLIFIQFCAKGKSSVTISCNHIAESFCEAFAGVAFEEIFTLTTQGRVVQSPIKLTQFWFQFCNFSVRFSVYNVCPSALTLTKLKLHKTWAVKNIYAQEKLILRLTVNSGLALTGFRKPWPRCLRSKQSPNSLLKRWFLMFSWKFWR